MRDRGGPRLAVLILAHRDPQQLNRLIAHLAADFAVFVHIDAKSAMKVSDLVCGPNITVMKKHSVYWGSFNVVLATIELMRTASALHPYDRYLLISGQDIPLKRNDDLIDFFRNNPAEYIEATKLPAPFWGEEKGGFDRLSKFHARSARGVTGFRRSLIAVERAVVALANRVLGPRRIDYDYYGGSQWFNLTHRCVESVLNFADGNPSFLRRLRFTHCPDEIFVQTAIKASGADFPVVDHDLRYVDWSGPEYPRVLRFGDFEKVASSGMLFARKIDENVDSCISSRIYELVSKQQ